MCTCQIPCKRELNDRSNVLRHIYSPFASFKNDNFVLAVLRNWCPSARELKEVWETDAVQLLRDLSRMGPGLAFERVVLTGGTAASNYEDLLRGN